MISQSSLCASTGYRKRERGSALIAVLIILLVITVLGVMAMRQGLTTLGISTNAQVHAVLVQSADTVLNQYATTDLTIPGGLSIATVIGAAIDPSNLGREVVFCYRPTSGQTFGMALNANIIHANTNLYSSTLPANNDSVVDDSSGGGFCKLDTDFGSARSAAVTQVAVTQPTDPSPDAPGSHLARDTSVSEGTLPKSLVTQQRVRVTATALLPSMATSSSTWTLKDIQDTCLGKRISDDSDLANTGKETVTDCLARYGVPANTQVQEYNVSSGLSQTTDIN